MSPVSLAILRTTQLTFRLLESRFPIEGHFFLLDSERSYAIQITAPVYVI